MVHFAFALFANHCIMQLRENVSNEVIVVGLKSTTLTFLSPLDTHIEY